MVLVGAVLKEQCFQDVVVLVDNDHEEDIVAVKEVDLVAVNQNQVQVDVCEGKDDVEDPAVAI